MKELQKTAVIYCRHSAEDKQEFSIPVQKQEIKKFAKKHNIRIIKCFADAGKTGLNEKRPGFLKLYEYAKKNKFDYVLVFDVTRWGRFQDTDESAFYEIQFKREGKKVIYIDKGFMDTENPLLASLTKSIDRYMAADYSRKLSQKVFLGSVKIAGLGFSVGGKAPFGLKRLLLDANKKPIRILKDGERKCIDNERVTFTPGDKKEIQVIKRIFGDFVEKRLSSAEIAEQLNHEKIRSPGKKKWDTDKIRNILINENYIGTKVYNKTSQKLKTPSKANPQDKWIRCKNAFEGIISEELFFKAKQRLEHLRKHYSEEELLSELKKIYDEYKKITSELINKEKSMACSGTYTRRFVSLYNAYIKIDYLPKRGFNFFKKREKQRLILVGHVKEKLNEKGYRVAFTDDFLYINKKKLLVIPSIPRKRKENKYWTFYFETKDVDYILAIGFENKEGTEIGKYYLFPKDVIEENVINVNINGSDYENYAIKELKEIIL